MLYLGDRVGSRAAAAACADGGIRDEPALRSVVVIAGVDLSSSRYFSTRHLYSAVRFFFNPSLLLPIFSAR